MKPAPEVLEISTDLQRQLSAATGDTPPAPPHSSSACDSSSRRYLDSAEPQSCTRSAETKSGGTSFCPTFGRATDRTARIVHQRGRGRRINRPLSLLVERQQSALSVVEAADDAVQARGGASPACHARRIARRDRLTIRPRARTRTEERRSAGLEGLSLS